LSALIVFSFGWYRQFVIPWPLIDQLGDDGAAPAKAAAIPTAAATVARETTNGSRRRTLERTRFEVNVCPPLLGP
jgi:hypothetical protein